MYGLASAANSSTATAGSEQRGADWPQNGTCQVSLADQPLQVQ